MDTTNLNLGRRSFFQRISDWLFGRDFFISYRWEDGRHYAAALAERLKAARFDCFLDSEGFLKGDNWRKVGARELRKTSRLVLVGSPGVHASERVAHELKLFGQTGRRIILIEFGDSLSSEKYPTSVILPLLDRAVNRLRLLVAAQISFVSTHIDTGGIHRTDQPPLNRGFRGWTIICSPTTIPYSSRWSWRSQRQNESCGPSSGLDI